GTLGAGLCRGPSHASPRSRRSRTTSTVKYECSRPSSSTTGTRSPYSARSSGSPSTSTASGTIPASAPIRASVSAATSQRRDGASATGHHPHVLGRVLPGAIPGEAELPQTGPADLSGQGVRQGRQEV